MAGRGRTGVARGGVGGVLRGGLTPPCLRRLSRTLIQEAIEAGRATDDTILGKLIQVSRRRVCVCTHT